MLPLAIAASITSLGGIAAIDQLKAVGFSADSVERAARTGMIQRVRRGVYANTGVSTNVVRAARVGGALASVSAASSHHLWVPPHPELHVSVRADAHHLKSPDDAGKPLRASDAVRLIRDGHNLDRGTERWQVSLATCIAQSMRNVTEEYAIAMIDSALRPARDDRGRMLRPAMTPAEIASLRARLPRRFEPLFGQVDARAESGSESVCRVRLARAGVMAIPQVRVLHDIRVDLLIGDRMIVEVGSFAHHGSTKAYEADHRRWAVLAGVDYLVLDFTYNQVMWDWKVVESVILSGMARGDHLSRVRVSAVI